MDCTIVGLQQELNFSQNVTLTYLVLRLWDGTELRVPIDEAAAAKIVELQVKTKGTPGAAASTGSSMTEPSMATSDENELTAYAAPPTGEDDGPRIFSAEKMETYEPTADAPTAAVPAPAAEPPQPPRQAQPPQKPHGRMKRVPMDSAGYPVVPGVDASSVTTTSNADEDGVGSV